MSDDDEKSGPIDLTGHKEEALHLKTLAEEKYNSGDLHSAVTYANRARDLYPQISGLPEMLAAFEILCAAAVPAFDSTTDVHKPTPDYYRILHVQRFSHINSIKKQYKKLAWTLHPDKNPFEASEKAFKLVGEAARVLSDKIRRKEYDTRLRTVMQLEAARAAALGPEDGEEAFSTACSACRLMHQFERKYLGHNLMCPSCKKTFKATEVKKGNAGGVEKNEGIGGGETRVSARLKERVAKGGYVGIVEKSGLGVKKRNGSVGEVSENLVTKVARSLVVNGDGVENCGFEKMGNLISVNGDVRVEGGVEEELGNGEDENITLSQMRMMMKSKKRKTLVGGKLTAKGNGVNAEKFKANEREEVIEREHVKENVREEERAKKEAANLRKKENRRRVAKVRPLKDVIANSKSLIDLEKDRSSGSRTSEVLLVERE